MGNGSIEEELVGNARRGKGLKGIGRREKKIIREWEWEQRGKIEQEWDQRRGGIRVKQGEGSVIGKYKERKHEMDYIEKEGKN